MTNSRTEVPTVEGVAHTRVPPPLGPDQSCDPYTGDSLTAERMTEHVPDDTCRWVARHRVADCGYPRAPGQVIPPNARFARQIARPVTAADLSEVPKALAQPEPPAPWETQP